MSCLYRRRRLHQYFGMDERRPPGISSPKLVGEVTNEREGLGSRRCGGGHDPAAHRVVPLVPADDSRAVLLPILLPASILEAEGERT